MSDEIILNKGELAFLGAIAYSELGSKAIKLNASGVRLFHKARYPHLNVAWNAFMQFVKTHRSLKHDSEPLAAFISETVEDCSDLPDEFVERVQVIMKRLLDGDKPDKEAASSMIEYLVEEDARRKLLAQLNDNEGFHELQRTLDAAVSNSAELKYGADEAVEHRVLYKPFKDIELLARRVERIPTGIDWLDELSSGGGRPGEMWLVLGPTGGGKSQFTVQYACQQALMGRGTVWATYEQTLEGDLAERIIANVTNTDLKEIRDRGFTGLDERIQSAFRDTVSGMEDKLYALDMTRVDVNPDDKEDNGGMYTVWKQLKQIKATECRSISTVIVDWVGAMAANIAEATGKTLDNGTYRFIVGEELRIAMKMAKEEHVLVIFLHQTNTEAQEARPTFCPNSTSTKDMRDMSHWMDLVLAMGKRDINDICWFATIKGRKGNLMKLTTKLLGGLARFVKVTGYQPAADGNFYNPKEMYDQVGIESLGVKSKFNREVE